MGKDLSHLTSEEIETLMRRYYDGEAVSKLIKEYNISVHASELYYINYSLRKFTKITLVSIVMNS